MAGIEELCLEQVFDLGGKSARMLKHVRNGLSGGRDVGKRHRHANPLIEEVTAEQIIEIAKGVELDAVYFLKGEETE